MKVAKTKEAWGARVEQRLRQALTPSLYPPTPAFFFLPRSLFRARALFFLLPPSFHKRRLCVERLYARHTRALEAGDGAGAAAALAGVAHLGGLYDILRPMEGALPMAIRASLVANLAPALAAPGADGPALEAALREGLGLDPPRETFWKPLGALTSGLSAEDKIWLLVDLVPCFARPDGPLAEAAAGLPAVGAVALAAVQVRCARHDPPPPPPRAPPPGDMVGPGPPPPSSPRRHPLLGNTGAF